MSEVASVAHVFPYHPAHLQQSCDDWVDLQLQRWPLAAIRASSLAPRSTVHFIGDRNRSFEAGGLSFREHRSRFSGPRFREFGQDWSMSLERELRRLGPDDICVLHLNAYDAAKLADRAAGGTRLVVVFHGRGVLPWGVHPAGADRFVVLRSDARDELIAAGARPDRIVQAVPSVDVGLFAPPPSGDWPEPPVIGFVGRVDWAKGIYDIAPAVRNAHDAGIPVTVDLVGTWDPVTRDRLAESFAAHRVEGAFRLLGPLGPRDVAARMRTWRALIAPSHSEGFSIVALEACASRIPVVAVEGVMPSALEASEGTCVAPREELGLALVRALGRDQRPPVPPLVMAHVEAGAALDAILEGLGEWMPRELPPRPILRRLRRLRPARRVAGPAARVVRHLRGR